MTDDPDFEFDDAAAEGVADELAGIDVVATLANLDGRTDYRRSVPYGRDGRPLHDVDRLATPPGVDSWLVVEPEDGDGV